MVRTLEIYTYEEPPRVEVGDVGVINVIFFAANEPVTIESASDIECDNLVFFPSTIDLSFPLTFRYVVIPFTVNPDSVNEEVGVISVVCNASITADNLVAYGTVNWDTGVEQIDFNEELSEKILSQYKAEIDNEGIYVDDKHADYIDELGNVYVEE